MCILQSGKGGTLEKDPTMTMLNNTSSDSVTSDAFRRSLRFFGIRLARRINGWVTAVVAQREQQAQLTILRGLSDRDLKDFGLNRSQIGEGLSEAAAARSRCQQSRK
jgi:uncharacterized protein YjiS (DUF1127 family)